MIMSCRSIGQTSSPEENSQATIDVRKRKRMISNRESARRSRIRKQQHLDDLVTQATHLKNQNIQIATQIDQAMQQYIRVDCENAILRAQVSQLTHRLLSVNSVLRLVGEVIGLDLDIPEMPEPLLKPWQFPAAPQPIMASADLLKL